MNNLAQSISIPGNYKLVTCANLKLCSFTYRLIYLKMKKCYTPCPSMHNLNFIPTIILILNFCFILIIEVKASLSQSNIIIIMIFNKINILFILLSVNHLEILLFAECVIPVVIHEVEIGKISPEINEKCVNIIIIDSPSDVLSHF